MPDEKKPDTSYRIPTPKSVQSPVQPKTTELPALTDRALLEDLTRVVKSGFAELRADMHLVSTDLQVVKDRVVIIERWKVESEERLTRASGGTRQLSEADSKHDAAIGALVAKVETIEKKTDVQTAMLGELLAGAKSVFKNPFVRALGVAIATALAAKYGIKVLP